MNADWRFLQELRDVGRACAAKWLEEHFDDVGLRSSTDIKSSFL
jgi:NTE family protein